MKDDRVLEQLAAALRDGDPEARLAAVHALARLSEPAAVLPLYELVRTETADPLARRAAAEELVTLGLLRRRRVGPSIVFLWLLGATFAIVCAAAAASLGLGAIALFAAGMAALVAYRRRAAGQERQSGTYIGPDRATIQISV
jgi:HEAT repeat protein